MVYLIATLRKSNDKIVGVRLIDTEKGTVLDADYQKTVQTVKSGASKIRNARVQGNKLIGTNCSIDRYTKLSLDRALSGEEKIVILSEGKEGTFTVCNYLGKMFLVSVETLIEWLDCDKLANMEILNEPEDVDFEDLDTAIRRIAGVTRIGDKSQDDYFEYTLVKDSRTGYIGWKARFIGTDKAVCDNKFNGYPIISMKGAFMGCKSETLDLSELNTSNVVDMSDMFYAAKVKSLDLKHLDTARVWTMTGMFCECEAERYNLCSFNTSRVEKFNSMFENCKANKLDLHNFDTSNAKSMCYMFRGCNMEELSISTFVTTNVDDITGMFSEVHIGKLTFGDFDTSKVRYMSDLFCASTIADVDIDKIDGTNAIEKENVFSESSVGAMLEIAMTK